MGLQQFTFPSACLDALFSHCLIIFVNLIRNGLFLADGGPQAVEGLLSKPKAPSSYPSAAKIKLKKWYGELGRKKGKDTEG
jgi:hypothetical protein